MFEWAFLWMSVFLSKFGLEFGYELVMEFGYELVMVSGKRQNLHNQNNWRKPLSHLRYNTM